MTNEFPLAEYLWYIMKKLSTIVYWVARLVAAGVLLQTLFFKFTASPESVYIFSSVGMEPWGRIGAGVLELMAGILLIIPATAWLGGVLALGMMSGAIVLHLTLLGIEVMGDDGYLFFLALLVAGCSGFVVAYDKDKILATYRRTLKIVS
jgi:uncharacterized membrane protein YphA (DoxX/SURF4 family)